MPSRVTVAVLLLWATTRAQCSGGACLCSALLPGGLKVNCSTLKLTELPPLPLDTMQLYVQDSWLTSVPPGHFDRLLSLRKVSLSGNPFHCDCRIQYLRSWLLSNKAVVLEEPLCASPRSVAQKAISELGDDHFSSCAAPSCADGPYGGLVGLMLCCIIVLLLWSLRLAQRSTFTLCIDERHAELDTASLRSMRPKRRKRPHTVLPEAGADSEPTTHVERPHRKGDLLPQVLEALHRKNGAKIKAT